MYGFHDLNTRDPVSDSRSVDAISYNGHVLDDEITGFKTLTVDGRTNFSRSLNAPDVAGDGKLYLGSRIEDRKLEVKFWLKADSVAAFNIATAKLQEILSHPQVPVKFADEPNFHFTGTVTELKFETPLIDTRGTIEITCSDPYKKATASTMSGNGAMEAVVNNSLLIYPVKPNKFQCVATTGGSSVKLENVTTGKKFEANIAYSAGDTIVVDFANLGFQINQVSHLTAVDLSSNLDDFLISNGDQLKCNVDGAYSLEYEVKQL